MQRNSHDQELQDLYDQVLSGFGNGDDDATIPTPTMPAPHATFPTPGTTARSGYSPYDHRNGYSNTRAPQLPVSTVPRQQPTPPQSVSSISPTTPRNGPRPLPKLPPGAAMPQPVYQPFPDEKKSGMFDPPSAGSVGQAIRRLPQQPPALVTPTSDRFSEPYANTSSNSSYAGSPLDPVMATAHDLPLPSTKFNGNGDMNGRYASSSASNSQSPPSNSSRQGATMPVPYGQASSGRGDYFDETPGYRNGSSSRTQQDVYQSSKAYTNTWQDDNSSDTDLSRSNSQTLSFASTTSSSEPTPITSYSSHYNDKNDITSSSRSSLSQESADGTIIGGQQTRSGSSLPPPMRNEMTRSSSSQLYPSPPSNPSAGPSRRTDYEILADMKRQPLELHEESDDGFFDEDTDDENDDRYVNLALLSHLAVKLRDKVPRGTHVKGSIPYPRAFTGKDIVTTIQSQIQRELLKTMNISTTDRSIALAIARSLQGQLFFYEVEWGGRALTDGVEDVFMFLDDQENMSDAIPERSELPTGVVTFLTKCYASSCQDETPCYSWACPKRKTTLQRSAASFNVTVPKATKEQDAGWASGMSREILDTLPPSEIKRQTIIHKIVKKEEQYVEDLDLIERLFLRPLRTANPPVIARDELDDFVETVFANVLDLRECNKRLLEVMYVRQREQGPIIQRIGDVFLTAAAEFRLAYPAYVGHLPVAEKRLKDEMENNGEFKRLLEHCSRQTEARKLDLKHFLTRPSEHLQKYPVLLEAVMQETSEGNPDVDYLNEAIQSIKNLYTVATLRTFQNAMGKGPTSKLQWFDLVTKEQMPSITKHEAKRQSIMWELIQGEMAYVRDLELIDTIFIRPLWTANPPIIPRERLKSFLQDVFHNYLDILRPQRELLNQLHEIQREEHPTIRSITAPVFNAALNWTDAYMEYIPHHPIATYRVDEEMAKNPGFKKFIEQCTRHPDARKLDIKSFIMRPVARLLRYPLLLQGVMDAAPADHEDKETIPQVLEVIKDLGKAADGGVETAKQKVELWRYDANLVFKTGEQIDLDLRAETRSLIHTGKLLRQPEGTIDISGWTELFVMLFDNYLVMSKPRERDGIMKYHVNRRPIPLELLSLASFTDPPQTKGTAFLKPFQRDKSVTSASVNSVPNGDNTGDSRSVYPLTIHHNGRMGGLYTLYAETQDARAEWKKKLEEALSLRSVIQDSNKVFEIEPLSSDTFFMPALHGVNAPAWNNDTPMTGRVTCSVPFSTQDGRGLVAIGCAEGVWIGLRHDSKSLKRVLHLKNVTQCAMLEDFGIFLVLAEKALFAYHIEALVPSGPASVHATSAPQRLNGSSNVQFFTVGQLHGRTLIVYMKKKSMDSVFRMLEPVAGKINDKVKNPGALARMGIGSQKSDWFRTYREFFLPSEAYDVIYLKARIVVLCSKGFEIMDLGEFKSETIPRRDDPRITHIVKRLDSCKPLGMYRSSGDEFLLCYNEFGLYVDRHGETSRAQNEVVVEWEGTAEHVAFHPPYLLLFDLRFIEVRHIETGRLAQIIPGTELRMTWDGRGSSAAAPVQTPGPDGWQESTYQEPRVHGVMKANEPQANGVARQRAVVQQVFELVPTIPLYLPGSLQSPNTSSFFPPPSPPPTHSPNPSMSYGWSR